MSNHESHYEIFAFTDLSLAETEQALEQVGFRYGREGGNLHHAELDIRATAFANEQGRKDHPQQTRVTLGANLGEVLPQSVFSELQALMPDVEIVDAFNHPVQIQSK